MASFTSILSIVLLHFLFLILSTSFFREAHKLVAADDNLIRKECNNSEVPETCIRHVKTNPGAGKADRLGIATIVVGCIGNQAKISAANMTQLGSKEKDQKLKKVYQTCSKGLSNGAVNELNSANEALQNHKYDNAETDVVRALNFLSTCVDYIKHYKGKLPVNVVFNIKIYEELTESACRIIGRF